MSAEPAYDNRPHAKTHLSRFIERAERGEEVIVDRAGKPAAKVVSRFRRVTRTAIGSLAGQLDLSTDWDSTETNAEIAADFAIAS